MLCKKFIENLIRYLIEASSILTDKGQLISKCPSGVVHRLDQNTNEISAQESKSGEIFKIKVLSYSVLNTYYNLHTIRLA